MICQSEYLNNDFYTLRYLFDIHLHVYTLKAITGIMDTFQIYRSSGIWKGVLIHKVTLKHQREDQSNFY